MLLTFYGFRNRFEKFLPKFHEHSSVRRRKKMPLIAHVPPRSIKVTKIKRNLQKMAENQKTHPAKLVVIGEETFPTPKNNPSVRPAPVPFFPISTLRENEIYPKRSRANSAAPDFINGRIQKPKNRVYKLRDASEIGIDGVPQIIQSRSWSCRLFWIILILLALSATLYELYKTFDDYYNNPILTTYTVKPVSSRLDFPDVYICPTNPVNETNRKILNWDPSWLTMLTAMQTGTGSDNETNGAFGLLKKKASTWDHITQIPYGLFGAGAGAPVPENGTESISDIIGSVLNRVAPEVGLPFDVLKMTPQPFQFPSPTPDMVTEYFMTLGYDADKFIEECSFNMTAFEKCSQIAQPILDRNYGKCFLVSMKSHNFYQVTPGLGLSLVLNIHTDHYPHENGTIFDGAYVFVQDRHDPASGTKLLLQPGTYTTLNLRRQDYSLLKVESGESRQICYRDDEFPEFHIMNSTAAPYSTDLCKMDCFQRTVFNRCDCLLMIDRRYLNSTFLSERRPNFCDSDRMIDCVSELTKNETQNEEIKNCYRSDCHIPCQWREYEISTSSLRLTSRAMKNGFNWMLDDYILLDIAFDRMRVVSVAQNASMTFDTFVGNIGGQISLFFGSSLLALAHAFVLCCFLVKRRAELGTNLLTGKMKKTFDVRRASAGSGLGNGKI